MNNDYIVYGKIFVEIQLGIKRLIFYGRSSKSYDLSLAEIVTDKFAVVYQFIFGVIM